MEGEEAVELDFSFMCENLIQQNQVVRIEAAGEAVAYGVAAIGGQLSISSHLSFELRNQAVAKVTPLLEPKLCPGAALSPIWNDSLDRYSEIVARVPFSFGQRLIWLGRTLVAAVERGVLDSLLYFGDSDCSCHQSELVHFIFICTECDESPMLIGAGTKFSIQAATFSDRVPPIYLSGEGSCTIFQRLRLLTEKLLEEKESLTVCLHGGNRESRTLLRRVLLEKQILFGWASLLESCETAKVLVGSSRKSTLVLDDWESLLEDSDCAELMGEWKKRFRLIFAFSAAAVEDFDVCFPLIDEISGGAQEPTVESCNWAGVGAMEGAKALISKTVSCWDQIHPSGWLLHGPPGTGKTHFACSVAKRFGWQFFAVKGPELLSMYIGETEKNVRDAFQQAVSNAPSVLFFDEVDSLVPNRHRGAAYSERIVSQFGVCFDSIPPKKKVLVVAATNRIDLVDPALVRPGRFGQSLFVGNLQSVGEKLQVLQARLSLCKILNGKIDVQAMERIALSFSAEISSADIAKRVELACQSAIKEKIKSIDEEFAKSRLESLFEFMNTVILTESLQLQLEERHFY